MVLGQSPVGISLEVPTHVGQRYNKSKSNTFPFKNTLPLKKEQRLTNLPL